MIDDIMIADFMEEDLVCLEMKSKNKSEALVELSELISKSKNINSKDNSIYKALLERENLGSTGIGRGVAIPHAKTEDASKLTVAFGISRNKIDFDSMDDEKIGIFFVFASPSKDSKIYLKVLARVSRIIREEDFRKELYNCKTAKEVIDCIRSKEGA